MAHPSHVILGWPSEYCHGCPPFGMDWDYVGEPTYANGHKALLLPVETTKKGCTSCCDADYQDNWYIVLYATFYEEGDPGYDAEKDLYGEGYLQITVALNPTACDYCAYYPTIWISEDGEALGNSTLITTKAQRTYYIARGDAPPEGPPGVKTVCDVPIANVKTINDVAIALVKTLQDAS